MASSNEGAHNSKYCWEDAKTGLNSGFGIINDKIGFGTIHAKVSLKLGFGMTIICPVHIRAIHGRLLNSIATNVEVSE